MSPRDSGRAVTPLVGVVVLVAVCVALAGTVGVVLQSVATPPDPPPSARLDVTASADGRVAITHRGGDALDVGTLRVRVVVDGTPLDHQPPVPFFAARGFRGGPTGPFNSRSPNEWSAGERAGFRIASTNEPLVTTGSRVEVSVIAGGVLVWQETVTARAVSRRRPRSRSHRPRLRPRAVRGRWS